MRTVRAVLLVLVALFGIGTKSAAQFSYTLGMSQFYQPFAGGYVAGFYASILYKNINSYSDPSIVTVRGARFSVSQQVVDFCDQYGLTQDSCVLGVTGQSVSGNVQTGTIPIGGSFWLYNPTIDISSCVAFCHATSYSMAGFGLLGCQGPVPTPDIYAGRTCAADGYDGQVSLGVTFQYMTQSVDIPPFIFEASDLQVRPSQGVVPGPNGFVQAVPEPASWILMVTGLGLVAATVRRRRRA